MGSVKDLIVDDSPAGKLYVPPTNDQFGRGAWRVSGRFSVGDLKDQIPSSNIKDKAEALTMMTARFFEYLAKKQDIPTCYLGLLNKDGVMTDTQALLDKGQTSNIILMKLAHLPKTYSNGDLKKYREDLESGVLQCGVADVESIFRAGFPLGSSTFKRIFKAIGMGDTYEKLATYDQIVKALYVIRSGTGDLKTLKSSPLGDVLEASGLGTTIPNPGFILKTPTYDSTTKFEEAGDREITKEEEKRFSGLDDAGYESWTCNIFPTLSREQIEFCDEKNILNIDGKGECVAYRRKPVVTDFLCNPDENRLMIITKVDGNEWAIPSNKEIQRAIFRQEGVYSAIEEAKIRAEKEEDKNNWRGFMNEVLKDRNIDIKAVAEHSCNLMGYAVAEVANRLLEQRVFDAKPIDSWVREFIPYASKIERQG